jgi:hypothetical protein
MSQEVARKVSRTNHCLARGSRFQATIGTYGGVSKSLRSGHLARELRMVQLSATRCSCTAILWVSLVRFAAVTLCVASQRVFIVISVYFVIDSVRKLLDTPSYFICTMLMKASSVQLWILVQRHQYFRKPCLSPVLIYNIVLLTEKRTPTWTGFSSCL